MPGSWIEQILPLPRPEYAKQPEALLTDLLWGSEGSTLGPNSGTQTGGYLSQLSALPGRKRERLIPRRERGGRTDTTETFPIAEQVDLAAMVTPPGTNSPLIRAILESLLAPRARGDKSAACVPVHPDSVVLQTLHGLVNKDNPPDLALAIELVGWLGGAPGRGHVAKRFLEATCQQSGARDGMPALLGALMPALARGTWDSLTVDATRAANPWPGVAPTSLAETPLSSLSKYPATPFYWFWQKWTTLCNPENGWYGSLPPRRFVDWSTCLLRTALAFAYLWEAEFYMRVHALISERTTSGIAGPKHEAFQTFLREGATLATIESPLLPSTRKNAAGAMNAALAMGYVARRRFLEERWQSEPTLLPDSAVETIVEDWVEEMNARGRLGDLAARLVTDANTAKNTREFVRYLLLPRVADDDSADQADFYSLARSNSRNFWFEPGPEWLVVNTALLGEYSGGQCTLGMLVEDLSRLGIRVERWVLVGMLEESGLSTDSPDADSALVIRSGF